MLKLPGDTWLKNSDDVQQVLWFILQRSTTLVAMVTDAGVEHSGLMLAERALYLDSAKARARRGERPLA